MKNSDRFLIATDVVAQEVGDETVLLDLKRGTYFGLDAVGSRFWQLAEAGKSVAEILAMLLVEFEVSADELEKDTLRLANDLISHRLITPT